MFLFTPDMNLRSNSLRIFYRMHGNKRLPEYSDSLKRKRSGLLNVSFVGIILPVDLSGSSCDDSKLSFHSKISRKLHSCFPDVSLDLGLRTVLLDVDQAENHCVIGFICLTEIHVDQNQMTAFPVKKLLIKAAPFLEFLKFQFLKILAYLFLRTSCTKESGSGIPVKLHGHPETEITVCPGITSLGFIAVTEASWFTPERPSEIEDFWMANYPEIDTIPRKIMQMEKAGYIPTAHFILPENCWLEHFYAPQFPVQEAFLKEYAGNDAAADLITGQRYCGC